MRPAAFVKMKTKELEVATQREERKEDDSIKANNKSLREEQQSDSRLTYFLHEMDVATLSRIDRACVLEFRGKFPKGKKPKGYSTMVDGPATAIAFAKNAIGAV